VKARCIAQQEDKNSKRVRPDDSNVVVLVNERSERDLIRRLDEVEVDWSVVEKQLLSWGDGKEWKKKKEKERNQVLDCWRKEIDI
jgi:hypothetical protein